MENIESSNAFILNGYTVSVLPSNVYGSVQGITTLNDRIYVVKDASKQIDVFNAADYTRLEPILVDIEYPSGLVACSQHGCLYTSEERFTENTLEGINYVVKITLSTGVIDKWIVPGWLKGLSLTTICNLLVSIWSQRGNESDKLLEYTTHGELVRVISLESSLDCIYHAVEVSTDIFAVCHTGIEKHRVCTVDANGEIIKSYGGLPGSAVGELNLPINLATDNYQNVFVVDRKNNKIQMLSSTLNYLGEVSIEEVRLNTPRRMHFDQKALRLYVSHRN